VKIERQYRIRFYQSSDFPIWNEFVNNGKNSTFLFHRNFMDYHKNRFTDASLLIFEDETLVSILPANKNNAELHSHQGLSYGGFVFNKKIKLSNGIRMVKSTLQFLEENGFETLYLKMIPSIYNSYFSDELLYCAFLTNAILYRRYCLSVIDLKTEFEYSKDRKEAIIRGQKNQLIVKQTTDIDGFWNTILIPNLNKKHKTKPVHSLEEMKSLQESFPNNIKLFCCYRNDEMVAGTVIFETELVAHSQYISGNELKNELGSIDFLHDYLIKEVYKGKHYFDFGTSHEENGKKINSGLLYWKESFGAKTVCHDFYEIKTAHHFYLDAVLIQ
jgi:hypothetical protein